TPPNVNVHVMHEAYSHELISAGFWPGNADVPRAEYYAYAMPAIDGLASAKIRPAAAGWDADRGEFLLPYEAVRTAADPASMRFRISLPRMIGVSRRNPPTNASAPRSVVSPTMNSASGSSIAGSASSRFSPTALMYEVTRSRVSLAIALSPPVISWRLR